MKTFWDRFAFAYDISVSLNKKVYREMLIKTSLVVD